MILAITDGVGLTDKLSREYHRAKDIFQIFFNAQIEVLNKYGCPRHWRIVKTTGDGLIFVCIEDDTCAQECGKIPTHQFLQAVAHAEEHASLKQEKLRLRSVIHYCSDNEVFQGGRDLSFDKLKLNIINDQTQATLASDIFGLEVIRLARVASLAKGPFHLLTEDFVRALVKPFSDHKDMHDPQQVSRALQKWNQKYRRLARIGGESIPLPYLKGFDEDGMPHRVHLGRAYRVWEASFEGGKSR